jgi:hypothetical protein
MHLMHGMMLARLSYAIVDNLLEQTRANEGTKKEQKLSQKF